MPLKLSHLFLFFLLFSNNVFCQFIINGSAVNNGNGDYLLTPAQGAKVGSIWYHQKISLEESFELNFDLYFGTKENGADGIAFCLQPLSTSIGVSGGGLGVQGVNPSFFVEFDTYRNGGDPPYDHLALQKNGNVQNNGTNNLSVATHIKAGQNNVENGQWYPMRATWDAGTKRFQLFVDCNLRIDYTGDIINEIFNGDPMVFWGFTASTGGANNEHRVRNVRSTLLKIDDQTICRGEGIQLDIPATSSSFSWNPTTGIDDVNSLTPTFTPAQTTEYVISYDGFCNSQLSDTILIVVDNCGCEDSDKDGVCDDIDLDDDNDGVLDESECPNTYVSKAFQTSNGKTTTFLAPSADGGFQFDIFKLDNSFNLKVNGVNVVPNQIQCFGNGLAGESLLVFDSDNKGFGQGGNDQVWVINGDSEKPVVRLKVNADGAISFEGKRSSGRDLEPMRILSSNPQPANITWNTTGDNKVVLSQKVDGPTNISGEGYGIVLCSTDTDGDGIINSLDTDSDGDGCEDALEGGAGFEKTDLSGEALSGAVDANGVPVLAGNGQTVGTSNNELQKAPACFCDDNDGDGICDDDDLDDDNDGILDNDECMNSNFEWSGVPTVNGKTAIGIINGIGYTYTSSINIETTSTIFAFNKFPSDFNIPNTTVIKNRFTSNNVITFDHPVLNPTLIFSSIGGGPTVPIEFSNPVEVLFQSGPVTINSPTKITGKEGYVVLRMNGVFNQISFDYLADENYVNFTFGADFATHCDTDGDGIKDYLDLDSDDDGCADAIEGDAGFKLSDINNGVLAGDIDANGVPVSAAGGQALGSSADENTQSVVCEVCATYKPVINGIDGTPFHNFYFDSSKELNETLNGLLAGEKYKIKVSGTFSVWSSDPTKNVMDAAYRYKEKNASADITPVAGIFWQINGAASNRPDSDNYNTEHIYYFERVATGTGEIFTWGDSNYGDNGGGLNFEFYKVLDTIKVCSSNSVTLLSDYVEGENLKWYTSETSIFGTNDIPSVDNSSFGLAEYWVTQTIDECESERTQLLYLVNKNPIVNLGNDTTICEDSLIIFDALAGSAWSWSNGDSTKSTTVNTSGDYSVVVSDGLGCTGYDTISLGLQSLPIVNLGNDTTICSDSIIIFDSGIGLEWNWSNGADTKTTTVNTIGDYSVVVSDELGCTGYDTISLDIQSLPIVNLGNDTTICADSIIIFDAGIGSIWSWSNGAATKTTTVNISGDYSVVVSDGLGCTGYDTISLDIQSLPIVLLGKDTVICEFDDLILNASNPNLNHIWSTGENSQTIVVDKEGLYSVNVFDSLGCLGTDDIYITQEFLPDPFSEKEYVFCEGTTITLAPDSYYEPQRVFWKKNVYSSILEIRETGAYTSYIQSEYCIDTFVIHVTKIDTPDAKIIDLKGEDNYCFDLESTNLRVTGENDIENSLVYNWVDFGREEEVNIIEPGVYKVFVSNDYCTASYVHSVNEYCLGKLHLPNSFTPNNDGINDVFKPVINDYVSSYNLKIYDRWGVLIFQTTQFGEGWNGRLFNNVVQIGVYVYKVGYNYYSDRGVLESKELIGTVSLLK